MNSNERNEYQGVAVWKVLSSRLPSNCAARNGDKHFGFRTVLPIWRIYLLEFGEDRLT